LKKRNHFVTISIVITSVALILYFLADRYLIEHVEVENALVSSETTNSITDSSETTTVDETYEADDLSYTSDSKSIQIEKVVTGSGSNQVTYYVADVQLTDSSSLKSAFANNQFGNNIVQVTSEIASKNNAIFAINGDYYGFREDGITIRNGQIFRDVPARTGLAFYEDGSMKIYEETETTAEELIPKGVTQTFSFGPALVENSVAIEDFGDVSIDKNFGNRSIEDSNPRTGVGIISENHYVFVVVDGRSEESKGLTLGEFAQVFEDLGATEAYNLDGGGSSTMYFMGRVVNNPRGTGEERGVSDIIYIQ
jgi:exopolysaccharide biosynthesis protein